MNRKRICVALNLEEGLNRYSQLYRGIQEYAQREDWITTWNHFPQVKLNKLSPGDPLPYDGIIGRITEDIYESAKRLDIPMVNIWLNSPVQNLPSVNLDFKHAGTLAAQHLLSRGYKNFVCVDAGEKASAMYREGLVEALAPFEYPVQDIHYNPKGPIDSRSLGATIQ